MEKLIKILIFDDAWQADLLENILSEREIPYMIKSYHDSALDGLFQMQKGWGHLEAPGQFRNEILEIFQKIKKDNAG